MGYLHHANYFVLFEMGRTELLRASGGNYRRMEEEGLFVVVVKAECRYHRPARYDDVLRVETVVSRVTNATIGHQYRVFRQAELLATGLVVLAIVGRNGKVQMVPRLAQRSMSVAPCGRPKASPSMASRCQAKSCSSGRSICHLTHTPLTGGNTRYILCFLHRGPLWVIKVVGGARPVTP